MPDSFPPSEYGGKVQRNTVQPPRTPRGHKGHTPTASEKATLMYTTGDDEDSTKPPDNGEAFSGLLPEKEARAAMPKQEKFVEREGW